MQRLRHQVQSAGATLVLTASCSCFTAHSSEVWFVWCPRYLLRNDGQNRSRQNYSDFNGRCCSLEGRWRWLGQARAAKPFSGLRCPSHAACIQPPGISQKKAHTKRGRTTSRQACLVMAAPVQHGPSPPPNLSGCKVPCRSSKGEPKSHANDPSARRPRCNTQRAASECEETR